MQKLAKLADEAGLPIHHMALLWCLANPHVSTVILGASKLSQLKDNLKALDARDKLTPDVLAKIEEIVGNKPAGPQRFLSRQRGDGRPAIGGRRPRASW